MDCLFDGRFEFFLFWDDARARPKESVVAWKEHNQRSIERREELGYPEARTEDEAGGRTGFGDGAGGRRDIVMFLGRLKQIDDLLRREGRRSKGREHRKVRGFGLS